jgi:hypothetical protein
MATNVYFSPKVKQEQNLYEDIVIEALKMYGQDVIYLPRNLVSYDNITNSEFSEFVDAYAVEMYIENTEGFGGEGDLMSKFGLEIRDTATFVVSKRRWEQLVGIWNNSLNSERPSEGDLIYLPLSNSLFEIKMTEHEQPFYQLNNLPVYKLQCETFEYSGEEFETGNFEIDSIEAKFATVDVFTVTASQPFLINETVKQDTGEVDGNGDPIYVIGEVSYWDQISTSSIGYLSVNDQTGSDGTMRYFKVGSVPIVGELSGAQGIISEIKNDQSDFAQPTDPAATNTELQDFSNGFIDFSEANPFGEVSTGYAYDNAVPVTTTTTSITMDVSSTTMDSDITMDTGA